MTEQQQALVDRVAAKVQALYDALSEEERPVLEAVLALAAQDDDVQGQAMIRARRAGRMARALSQAPLFKLRTSGAPGTPGRILGVPVLPSALLEGGGLQRRI